MINVSPIGRNASVEERNEYEVYVEAQLPTTHDYDSMLTFWRI